LLALAIATCSAVAVAQADPVPPSVLPETTRADDAYLGRAAARFESFAGSPQNLRSLAIGLRRGSEISLEGAGEAASFQPPTRPMGYGNITRALDLASRQLAAAGIAEPTPQQIQAALTGGTIVTATGETTLQGVLQLRSQGMGWGQISHAVGVHPGLGSTGTLPAPPAGASGITTAAGAGATPQGRALGQGAGASQAAGHGAGITSAAGAGALAGTSKGRGHAYGRAGGRP